MRDSTASKLVSKLFELFPKYCNNRVSTHPSRAKLVYTSVIKIDIQTSLGVSGSSPNNAGKLNK